MGRGRPPRPRRRRLQGRRKLKPFEAIRKQPGQTQAVQAKSKLVETNDSKTTKLGNRARFGAGAGPRAGRTARRRPRLRHRTRRPTPTGLSARNGGAAGGRRSSAGVTSPPTSRPSTRRCARAPIDCPLPAETHVTRGDRRSLGAQSQLRPPLQARNCELLDGCRSLAI